MIAKPLDWEINSNYYATGVHHASFRLTGDDFTIEPYGGKFVLWVTGHPWASEAGETQFFDTVEEAKQVVQQYLDDLLAPYVQRPIAPQG